MNVNDILRRSGLSSDGTDVTLTAGWFKLGGRTQTVGGTSVRVFERDNAGLVLLATGTTVPTAAGAGYAKGCRFIKTNATTGADAVFLNAGTTASCAFVTSGSIRTDTVQITNAQIKALRATAKTLVAAPGANLILEFMSAVIINNGGTNALTESTANLVVRYTNTTGAIVSETIESTGFIDQTAATISNAIPKMDAIVAAASGVNKALVLHNVGAGEIAGNAALDVTLTVVISYRIVPTA